MTTDQHDADLDLLAAELAAEPHSLPGAGPGSRSAAELWARGRSLRRRRQAVAAGAAVLILAGAGGVAAGLSAGSGRAVPQQLAAGSSADLQSAAQAALGPDWVLTSTSSRARPATTTPSPGPTRMTYPEDPRSRISDDVNLGFTRKDMLSDPPQAGSAYVSIQSVQFTDPALTEQQAADYAAHGGAASHYPDDGTRADILSEQTPTSSSHVWVVQMPDKNTLLGVIWHADGHLAQVIEPAGEAPALGPDAVASLAAALARA